MGMVEAALHAESQGGEAALTCFGQVPQGGAECAPLQPLAPGVAVIKACPGQGPVPGVLLQAGALRHTGTHHPLLLLQLGCNTHGDFYIGVRRDKTTQNIPVSWRGVNATEQLCPSTDALTFSFHVFQTLYCLSV